MDVERFPNLGAALHEIDGPQLLRPVVSSGATRIVWENKGGRFPQGGGYAVVLGYDTQTLRGK